MNEMVERVALKICEALGDWNPVPMNKMAYEDAARAAISAMREPTDAMCDTLYDFGPSAYMEPEEVMAALIDAALGEKWPT